MSRRRWRACSVASFARRSEAWSSASQGKACGVISRASIVRWFLENRWAVRLMQRAIKEPLTAEDGAAAANDPTLETVGASVGRDGRRVAPATCCAIRSVLDAAPIIGGALRMQQLLEDLLSARRPVKRSCMG